MSDTTTASLELGPRDRGAGRPRGRLIAVSPPGVDLVLSLATDVVLGRRSSDDPGGLDDRTVSRRHVAITRDAEGGVIAMDLGSRNGSLLDGTRLPPRQPRPLAHGAVLRVGRHLFVFEDADVADEPSPIDTDALPGRSAAATALRAAIARCAADPSPVLVLGETGTGKERIVREIHRLSGRRGPLVSLNCAELNAQLIESQLFGHVKGAFTGAVDAQAGLFRAAHGGTLFLDEIAELPVELQATLLRAIEEGEVRPVGSTRTHRVDVRVVAATHRDLVRRVEREEFRRDLYARLALWEVRAPPLRERRADILHWVRRLFAAWRDDRGLDRKLTFELDVDAAELLVLHDWPLNLRGVVRVVHQLAPRAHGSHALSGAQIADALGIPAPAVRLPSMTPTPAPAFARPKPKPPQSAEELASALEKHGSVRAVARHYERDRRQVYRWLERFGLEPPG